MFHNLRGHYNSLILQVWELLSRVSSLEVSFCSKQQVSCNRKLHNITAGCKSYKPVRYKLFLNGDRINTLRVETSITMSVHQLHYSLADNSKFVFKKINEINQEKSTVVFSVLIYSCQHDYGVSESHRLNQ